MYRDSQEDEIEQFFREKEGGLPKEAPKPVGIVPDQQAPFHPVAFDQVPQETPRENFGGYSAGAQRRDYYEQLREEAEHIERQNNCREYSKRYMQMFIILIANVFFNIIGLILSRVGANDAQFRKDTFVFSVVVAIGSVVCYVLYGLVLIMLSHYNMDFRPAGTFFILSGICQATSRVIPNNTLYLFTSLAASVFAVLYVLKFASAASTSFDKVALYMSSSWETFRKVYMYVYIATAAASILIFMPVLGLIMIYALLALAIIAIGLEIWQILLLLRSSVIMKQYSSVVVAKQN